MLRCFMIEIEPASQDDALLLRNLTHLYAYDFGVVMEWPLDNDGTVFTIGNFDDYFEKPDHTPLLLKYQGHPAGFALVHPWSNPDEAEWDLEEFFIVRQHRRNGLGKALAFHAFDQFRGRWIVRQLPRNEPAIAFWRAILDEYTGGDFEERTIGSEGKWENNAQFFRSRG